MTAKMLHGCNFKLQRSLSAVAILAAITISSALFAQDGGGAGGAQMGQQGAPGGMPGGSGGPGGMPPGGGGPGGSSNVTLKGAYSAGKGETKSESGKSYNSDKQDTSAVWSHDGGSITLDKPTVTTSGDTSSMDGSSFSGLNAGVLASKGGKLVIHGGTITTTGSGANGAFSYSTGSYVELSDMFIKATGGGGHGVMTAGGGKMKLTNVSMDTTGRSSAAIANDRGGGEIVAEGGTLKTAGQGSPSLYSTGAITVSRATMISTGAECAVIEGSNSITVIDSSMTCEKLDGAMLYQSFSGDAQGQESHFTLTGGSMDVKAGPIFYVTNTNATINVSGAKLTSASGVLLSATAARWGNSGANGGHATLNADKQELPGDITAGSADSTIQANLKNGSTLNGAIQGATLSLDATSKWIVKADSKLAGLSDQAGLSGDTITNIQGNGHTVTYKSSDKANGWLAGKSYSLAGGGKLVPAN